MAHNQLPDEDYIRHAKAALERPGSFLYYGSHDLFGTWGMLPFAQHRDSDVLERSNYRTIFQALKDNTVTKDGDAADDWSEYVDDFRASSWLTGWIEQIVCRVLIDGDGPLEVSNLTDTFKTAVEIYCALVDYPIFDSSDYSELEYDESMAAFMEAWDSVWWSDVSPNSEDDTMKSAVWEELTSGEFPDSFDTDDIVEAVIQWTWDIAWEDYAQTYADQLALF